MAIVILTTNYGDITLEIDQKNAPITAQNFLNYVEAGFYNDTIFHRVIPGFMIQGGGLNQEMLQKPTNKPINNEANNGLQNLRGTVAMARTSDPHSASAQFFINVVDNHFLDFKNETIQGYGYCVFGKVIAGLDVVDTISHVNTVNRLGHNDVPEKLVEITGAKVQMDTQERQPSAMTP